MVNINNGKELVSLILKGERDFRGIVLPEATDLRKYIPELNEYLRTHLREDCLNFNGSKLIRIIAPKIYIPFSNMTRADIRGAEGLDEVLNLPQVIFYKTIVTSREREIIEKARGFIYLYDVRD
jgi:hypothetical protein